ncbi:hypothetical protein [Pseudomonas sp. GV071]|jgi:DNA-binding NarL/FixJ family response regulator|uniref:hypothetical protein n=1 Tax=Pseudomonas sp. GV071 TaxID=2135754 RepID=UPI000D35D726|nr:hypothetical protein [Pseudomonas sp. GV071]PTQ68150.1 hypothetical protein C8K61_11266 [Pseudomonas sp. GV071]
MHTNHSVKPAAVSMNAGLNQAEHQRIEQATREFLAQGGEIEQVGFQMRSEAPVFVINPERSPLYRQQFFSAALVGAQTLEKTPAELRSEAAAVMAAAALGKSPKWVAQKLSLSEKRVRQVARDYHITFRTQR